MDAHIVVLSVPITGGPVFEYEVEARDEDEAVDIAFERAFAEHPQFGSFQIDNVRN